MSDKGRSTSDVPRRRQLQKEQTKYAIIDAARRLFAENGYARTTVADVAHMAGVSPQTIYDSVGSKAQLVMELNELIDIEGGVPELAGRIPVAKSPDELLEMATGISRNINERCDDIIGAIWGAAVSEPELEAVRVESQRRHRDGIRVVCRRLEELGVLRADLDLERTADAFAALTDIPMARLLVLQYGWSWDEWQQWTIESLRRLFLDET